MNSYDFFGRKQKLKGPILPDIKLIIVIENSKNRIKKKELRNKAQKQKNVCPSFLPFFFLHPPPQPNTQMGERAESEKSSGVSGRVSEFKYEDILIVL